MGNQLSETSSTQKQIDDENIVSHNKPYQSITNRRKNGYFQFYLINIYLDSEEVVFVKTTLIEFMKLTLITKTKF